MSTWLLELWDFDNWLCTKFLSTDCLKSIASLCSLAMVTCSYSTKSFSFSSSCLMISCCLKISSIFYFLSMWYWYCICSTNSFSWLRLLCKASIFSYFTLAVIHFFSSTVFIFWTSSYCLTSAWLFLAVSFCFWIFFIWSILIFDLISSFCLFIIAMRTFISSSSCCLFTYCSYLCSLTW